MTDHREDSKLQLIAEEAAEWFVRFKDRDVDLADQRRYVKWLKESPTHVAEFLRAVQSFKRYRKAELPEFEREQSAANSNVVELVPRQREGIELSESAPKKRGMSAWKIAAAVATVTLSLLIGIVAKVVWLDRTIETGAGEWRQVALADGSTMRLVPLTKVTVEFGDRQRTINLIRGEAYFQVVKDKARPFHVDSGIASVRAVGTAFGVLRRKDDVTVTVSEGRVAITRRRATASQRTAANAVAPVVAELPVSADEQVEVTPGTWPSAAKKVNAARELAWVRQRLIFETETIAEAAAAFNRLNRLQISVDDPEIAQWRACCVFDATDPEAFAEAMAEESGIALVRDPFGVLHLVAESDVGEFNVQQDRTIRADTL